MGRCSRLMLRVCTRIILEANWKKKKRKRTHLYCLRSNCVDCSVEVILPTARWRNWASNTVICRFWRISDGPVCRYRGSGNRLWSWCASDRTWPRSECPPCWSCPLLAGPPWTTWPFRRRTRARGSRGATNRCFRPPRTDSTLCRPCWPKRWWPPQSFPPESVPPSCRPPGCTSCDWKRTNLRVKKKQNKTIQDRKTKFAIQSRIRFVGTHWSRVILSQ